MVDVTIKKSGSSVKFKVIDIDNPYTLYVEIGDDLTIKTTYENLEVIKNLDNDDLLVVGHKNH